MSTIIPPAKNARRMQKPKFPRETEIKTSTIRAAIIPLTVRACFLYAKTIVEMYHGQEAAKTAEERYKTVASGAIPQNIKEVETTEEQLSPVEMLVLAGFVNSTSEARKLVQNKGVKINGKVVENALDKVSITKEEVVISKGKSNFAKFIKK